MQLKPSDHFGGYGFVNLHTGPCGPIYVNQIWSEQESAGGYCDKYWDREGFAFPSTNKMMYKAEIECEDPGILNSILGQIKNIVACPYDEEPVTNSRLTCIGLIDKEEDLPSTANVGDFYYDKSNNSVGYIWLGNSWEVIKPYVEDPVEALTREIQEEMIKSLNDEIIKSISNGRYKLKHKVLYRF